MLTELLCGIYRHYKGGLYQVIGLAEHTETHERVVVYVALDVTQSGPRLRARPFDGKGGWSTPVQSSRIKAPIPRFEYVGAEIPTNES